jgi:acyl-CoA synthetase (AMP-forming)/AMP-acid ligase II
MAGLAMRTDIGGWRVRWDDDKAARFTAQGRWTNKTIADYAADLLERDPRRVVLTEGDQGFTVAMLHDEADTLARALVGKGLRPGDTISFQLPNWKEAAIINLAAAMAGLIVHPIIPIYRDAEVRFMLEDCRSKLVFLPRSFRGFDYVEMADRIIESLGRPLDVVVVRGDPGTHIPYENLLASARADVELQRAHPDAVKLIMYTSGTTGRAKGVLHSHNSLQAETLARREHLGLTAADVFFNPSPVTHVTGYLYSLVLPWLVGLKTVMMDIWEPQAGFDLMRLHGCTGTLAATIFLQQLVEIAKREREPLPALRFFLCGGAQVPPELILEAARIFPNCIPSRIYGSTEVPCVTAGVNDRADLARGATTDGEVLYAEVRIVDPADGTPVAKGEDGEVVARAPQMLLGYVREADNDEAFDGQGFFRTGDLGRLVDGRFLVITGRKKDIIIRAGENISPKEVEDILLRHPAIRDVAIVGMPDERTGEAACAFVIANGPAPDLAETRRFLAGAGIAVQKFPERIEIVDDFPRTAVGKVRKDLLRETARTLRKAPERHEV